MEYDFRKNIIFFYLITLFGGLAFIYDLLLVIYYQSFGLSFFQISVVLTVVSIFTLIFNIPSGAFADLYGKKKSLLISSVAFFLSFLIIIFFQNFISFVLAGAILGISLAFNLGAEDALVYDSLRKIGRKKHYLKVKSRSSAIFLTATIFTAFFGPFLYSINKFIPIALTCLFGFFGFLFTLFLREPKLPKKRNKHIFKDHLKQMKGSLNYVFKHVKIIWVILFSALFYLFCNAVGQFLEVPYLLNLGFVIRQVSYISVIALVIQVIISMSTEKLEKKLGENNSILIITLVTSVALFLTIFFHSYLISVFIGLFWGVATFRELVIDNYLNKSLKQGNRATVISISSMTLSLMTVIFLPLIGLMTDANSTIFSIIVISIASLIAGLIFYFVKVVKKI